MAGIGGDVKFDLVKTVGGGLGVLRRVDVDLESASVHAEVLHERSDVGAELRGGFFADLADGFGFGAVKGF